MKIEQGLGKPNLSFKISESAAKSEIILKWQFITLQQSMALLYLATITKHNKINFYDPIAPVFWWTMVVKKLDHEYERDWMKAIQFTNVHTQLMNE